MQQGLEKKYVVNLTEKLIQWLILSLFIYNDFIAFTIVTTQNMEYMLAQVILYIIQKLSFFYYCKNLRWSQALLELLEIGILTIKIKDPQSRNVMIGYFFRVFLMLHSQLFIIISVPTFQGLLLHKQILILASQILISIIITIAQSMKFRYFLTFLARWLFQVCLFGLFLLLLVSQSSSVVIPYIIVKIIVAFLANIVLFRKQYQHIKNQIKYSLFALIFYFCIDHGPFYEFRRKKSESLKITSTEVLLYTMHLFRLNQFLQIVDGCTIFLIDYSTSSFQGDYGDFSITKAPQDLSTNDFNDFRVVSYIRFISQILLSIFFTSFIVNQAMFYYANRGNNHPVYCFKKVNLRKVLDFLSKNKNLIYFSGSISDIDKGQLSRDNDVNIELQELVDLTINYSRTFDHNFYEIKVKDINNSRLICNQGELFEIDYVLHDFFVIALQNVQLIKNKRFIYLQEENQMTPLQKKELQDALNFRILNFGIQDIQVQVGNLIFKQDIRFQTHNLKIITFYKYLASFQLINPSYILYDLLS